MRSASTNSFMMRKAPTPVLGPLLLLAALMVWQVDDPLFALISETIAEAYLQVSTFVAGTLFLFYGIERVLRVDLTTRMAKAGFWQVPIAALLGALPGCGGAIIVMTRYSSGQLSFGAVLAVLTATMGDAAFLLLAKEPSIGLLVMVLGFVVGSLTGWLVDVLHGTDFMRPHQGQADQEALATRAASQSHHPMLEKLWLLLFLPGLVFGIAGAFQIDMDALLATSWIDRPATLLGFISGVLCLIMWILPRLMPNPPGFLPGKDNYLRAVITDTNFVTSWVVAAFLLFEVGVYALGLDLSQLFSGLVIWTPLIGVLVGFIPGCGPQIVVTSLYLAGAIPLSAQLGNAISNDGDALFPAIALAPRAAIVATLYSALPALAIGYGWYFVIGS